MYSEVALIGDCLRATTKQVDSQVIRDRVQRYLDIALLEGDTLALVRDTDRVDSYGEVFTPNWFVKQMLNLMSGDPGADLTQTSRHWIPLAGIVNSLPKHCPATET